MAISKKRRKQVTPTNKKRKVLDLAARDEQLDSDDDDSIVQSDNEEVEQEDLETKRVRLAREYLDRIDQVENSSDEEDEQEEDDEDPIARKLQKQRLKSTGVYERNVADVVAADLQKASASVTAATTDPRLQMQEWLKNDIVRVYRAHHDLTVTGVGISGTDKAVSGSKDHSVVYWNIETEQVIGTLCESWKKDKTKDRTEGQVCAVACSDDGRYAAVGARDALVRIYDLRQSNNKALVNTFRGHRGPVTSLCFRANSLQLFSASTDRTIRHYNLQEMMYLETLYGHQSEVQSVDCCIQSEMPVSVGRDRTARMWKLAQDSHLIFRGGSKLPAANSVSVPKDGWFVTGHENNTVCLWKSDKKKAVTTIPLAHDGPDGVGVVHVKSLRGSDLTLTGSNDGFLRLWKVRTGIKVDQRGLDLIGQVPLHGYINDIAMGPKARFCLVAMGQEHRLGRWSPVKKAKNRVVMVKLRSDNVADDEKDDASDDEEKKDDDDDNDKDDFFVDQADGESSDDDDST